ncbi:holo-ACP synthase [Alteromonas ponticola]|uniref:Holo-[acyl-carrier-protein] synthase n=1 Tax=Alteromonas aquimaris TaxID=2998417 RepID=A0ABT3P9H6_9ALTE|nr:holo-ACP synthase [Alteromonas aquimaris]MCW8109433.1 holo-ACP synthase [Alteromonas aquimaris]
MAILGLGTDIIEIARLTGSANRTEKLAQRVLTDTELAIFNQHTQPERYLAKRFAAKEAAVKALGTGIGRGVGWHQVIISNNSLGGPELTFIGEALQISREKGVTRIHLSISDEASYAVATVILSSD